MIPAVILARYQNQMCGSACAFLSGLEVIVLFSCSIHLSVKLSCSLIICYNANKC